MRLALEKPGRSRTERPVEQSGIQAARFRPATAYGVPTLLHYCISLPPPLIHALGGGCQNVHRFK